MTKVHKALSYDAVSILCFGDPSDEQLPSANEDEVVILYGGWSLLELRDCPVVRERDVMWQENWYDEYQWSIEKLPVGIYRIRFPVFNSNRQTFTEQVKLLPSGEEPAPVVLVATAYMAHYLQTGEDRLKCHSTRCSGKTSNNNRVGLNWEVGRLNVTYFADDYRSDDLFMSSLRTTLA